MSDDRKQQLNKELAQLVRKIKEGDSQSFERLYELSLPRLTPYAYTLVKKEAETQDLLQDTYIRILDSIGSLRDENRFLPWANTIMHNIAMRGYRRSTKEQVVTSDDDLDLFDKIAESSDDLLPGLDLEKNEVQDAVFEMICDLPVKQRVTLLAYYYDSMKIREIADMMDCQEGTVKSRLYKAREAMKQKVLAYEKQSGVKIHSIAPFLGPALERYAESSSLSPEAKDALLSHLKDHISEVGVGSGGGSGQGSGSIRTAGKTMRHAAKPIAIGLAAVVAAGGMIVGLGAQREARNAEGMRTAVNGQIETAMTYMVENTAFSKAGIAKASSDVVRNTGIAGIDLNDDGQDELLMNTELPKEDSFEVLIVDGKKKDPEPNIYSIPYEKGDAVELFYVPGKKVGRIYFSRDSGGEKLYYKARVFADSPSSGYTEDITAKEFTEAVSSKKALKIDGSQFKGFDSGEEMSRYTEKRFGFTVDEETVILATLIEDRLLTKWQAEPPVRKMNGTAAEILGLDMELDEDDLKGAADCIEDMTAEISAGSLDLKYEGVCEMKAELEDGKLRPDTKVKISFETE